MSRAPVEAEQPAAAAAEDDYDFGDDIGHDVGDGVGDDVGDEVGDEVGDDDFEWSILQYRTMHGRTYHAATGNAQYWAANDDKQKESMDIVHHFLTLACDHRIFLAPLEREKVMSALDIGTGTGIWAIDFADHFPKAEVVGTDISPIQPCWVPPNLVFEMEDCTQDWLFEDSYFSYVHMRYLYGSVEDWGALLREAYRVTEPGGWVESVEASPIMESDDNTIAEGSAMHQWGPVFIEGAKEVGRTFTVVDDDLQYRYISEAGFTNIRVIDKKIPIGSWPKDERLCQIGQFVQLALEQDCEGYVQFFASILNWSRDEITVYCAQLRHEIRSRNHHAYFRLKIVYGQKPADAGNGQE